MQRLDVMTDLPKEILNDINTRTNRFLVEKIRCIRMYTQSIFVNLIPEIRQYMQGHLNSTNGTGKERSVDGSTNNPRKEVLMDLPII